MDDQENKSPELPFSQPEDDRPAGKKEDKDVVREVRNFMQKSDDYREPHLDLAMQSRDRYQNWKIESVSKTRRANLQPSYGFSIIETLVPQLCEIFLGDQHIVKFEGREPQDQVYEDSLTDFFDIQFEDMDFEPKFVTFIKNMHLDGTAIAKVPYRYREIVTMRREQIVDELGNMFVQRQPKYEVLYDGPDLEVVPFQDFFPDWRSRQPGDIQSMRGCVHRMYRSYTDLESLKQRTNDSGETVGVYKNLDELKQSLTTKGQKAWNAPYWSDKYTENFDQLNDNKQNSKDWDQVELWEYWGLFDVNGSGEFREYIITVANGDVVIRMDENFYDYQHKPFIACPNYIRSNEFYGIPELTAVDSEIREATAIRNARLDQINLNVNGMWMVDRGAGIDGKNLYSRPGGIVWTNDMNGLKPIQVPSPSVDSAQEIGFIEQNISQTTGIASPPITGGSKSFGRTATGADYVKSFSASRLGLKARILASCGISQLVHIMLMTDRQFVTDTQWIRASSPDSPNPFNELPPDAFFKNYDYNIKTKLEQPDEIEFQKLQAASQVLQVAEQTQPGSVKMDVVIEALLRPLIGPKVKKFMRSPEELQQLNMQNAALRVQEQAANAQIGQLAPQPNAGSAGRPGGDFNAV